MYAVLLRHREYYRAQIPVLVQALVELHARESPNLWAVCSILHMLAEVVVEFWEPTLAAMVEEHSNACRGTKTSRFGISSSAAR